MRVLMVHNYYRQPGGEDLAVDTDLRLLRAHGCDPAVYARRNTEIDACSPLEKARLFFRTAWSRRARRDMERLIAAVRPDVVHVQNFFPLISPAVLWAAARRRVPTVCTLHNYRLLCPAAVFFRDGHVCEECLRHTVWRGTRHACYRNSRVQTAAISLMLCLHRLAGTWRRTVTLWIAPSEFTRRKFLDAGFPAARMVVRPHGVHPDPGPGAGERRGAVFAGRLSPEKGIGFLLDAWRNVREVSLAVIGDGPLRPRLEARLQANGQPGVRLAGYLPPPAVYSELQRAEALVVPSPCYETFGRAALEAFATATPVIAARDGAVAELVRDGQTGWLFRSGDEKDLADKVQRLRSDPAAARRMGCRARELFESRYSAGASLRALMDAYARARARYHASPAS